MALSENSDLRKCWTFTQSHFSKTDADEAAGGTNFLALVLFTQVFEKVCSLELDHLGQGCQNPVLTGCNPTGFSDLLLPGRTESPAGLWPSRTGFPRP